VTILFVDMAGFTTLAEQLDPEEVHRFEGTINQYTGDGVMALFGAPVAHEDSPRRACTLPWACNARYGRTLRSCRHNAA
jgi:class 3 adenylate cyclase